MDRLTYLLKTVDVSCREELRVRLRTQLDDVAPFPHDLMLTWGHLKDMVAMGMEIGAHTMTHANLPSAQPDEAWFEIAESKTTLEKRLGIKVPHFAYPNGGSIQHYNDRVKSQVKKAGFLSATTSRSGIVSHKVIVSRSKEFESQKKSLKYCGKLKKSNAVFQRMSVIGYCMYEY